ncbi:hypothetical protein ACTFIZ_008078 [Dictyostelium cf. discoideum]
MVLLVIVVVILSISPGTLLFLNITTNTGACEVLVDVLFPFKFKSIPLIVIALGHIDSTSGDETGTDLYQLVLMFNLLMLQQKVSKIDNGGYYNLKLIKLNLHLN